MDSSAEYENRMLQEAYRAEQEVEKAPLSDRKEAQAEFLEALKDPALIAERIGWIIDGSYGYGQMVKAKRVVASPRMNREAALVHLVAVYEWRCPARMSVDAWKKLTPAEKKMLSKAVQIVISEAEKQEE